MKDEKSLQECLITAWHCCRSAEEIHMAVRVGEHTDTRKDREGAGETQGELWLWSGPGLAGPKETKRKC